MSESDPISSQHDTLIKGGLVVDGARTQKLDVAIKAEKISAVESHPSELQAPKEIDASGYFVIPGIIDAHNHLVWAGDRFNEHRLRMDGKTYADIGNIGGGILQTVHSTRNATDADLYTIGMQR